MLRSNSKIIDVGGQKIPLVVLARTLGLPHGTLHNRIARGWSVDRAITKNNAPQGYLTNEGYRLGFMRRPQHVINCEKTIGFPLPIGAVVHHVNENKDDNRNENLVVCQDSSYHNMLHRRMRAIAACGYASWRICRFCHQYDSPGNLYISERHGLVNHRSCMAKYMKTWLLKRKDYSER